MGWIRQNTADSRLSRPYPIWRTGPPIQKYGASPEQALDLLVPGMNAADFCCQSLLPIVAAASRKRIRLDITLVGSCYWEEGTLESAMHRRARRAYRTGGPLG